MCNLFIFTWLKTSSPILNQISLKMPPKGAARKEQLSKARPHFINCYECNLRIKCPKSVTNVDQIEVEHLQEEVGQREVDMMKVKDFLACQSIAEKSEIVSFILNSESDSIWEDLKKSNCNISQSTVQTLTDVNADDWYESRHPIIRTIAEELSKGAARRGHDQDRAQEREEKALTKSLKCRLIGACYKIVHHQFVSPIEIRSSILFKSVVQSKIGSIVLSRQGPCGSKDAFEQIVIKNCSPEVTDTPGDVLETIDNNERGSRTYSAKLNSSMKMSLVTARNIYK